MEKPNEEDAQRVFELRKRSKRGEYLSSDDMDFCNSMYKKYPEWYSSLTERVFEETRPFGSF